MLKDKARQKVVNESLRASSLYSPFKSYHEGIAIIREEYLELEKEVFRSYGEQDLIKIANEATHLGAMAIRFLEDLC